jgi:hypothetical protein
MMLTGLQEKRENGWTGYACRTSYTCETDVAQAIHAGTGLKLPCLLTIAERQKSGLILCQNHHAEFAGPGAAVSTLVERKYDAVIAIGAPELVEVTTLEERQKAYSRRIQWMRWLQRIAEVPNAVERVEKLFYGFEAFFGRAVLRHLPDEALALLIGTFSSTVADVRSRHYPSAYLDDNELASSPQTIVSILNFSPTSTFDSNSGASIAEADLHRLRA